MHNRARYGARWAGRFGCPIIIGSASADRTDSGYSTELKFPVLDVLPKFYRALATLARLAPAKQSDASVTNRPRVN
jgi:hypothetical protein